MLSHQRHRLGLVPALVFLIAVPAGVALWYALVKAGRAAQYFPFPVALVYWCALLVPRWWVQELASRGLDHLLSRWRIGRLPILLAGGFGGILLFQPYALWTISWFQQTFSQYIPAAERWVLEPEIGALFRGFYGTLPQHLVALALWVIGNLLLDVSQSRRRFGHQPESQAGAAPVTTAQAAAVTPAAAALPFATKLTRLQPKDVIAIEAEDHYIRVYSRSASEMIHYRFSDAVSELASIPGMRVHRSFWIARAAIDSIDRSGASPVVVLVNGVRVPIGRSYTEAARQLGIL